MVFGSCCSETTDGIADDDAQHDGSDEGIEPIVFGEEVDERKEHAQDGRKDEHQYTKLNPALSVERGEAAEDAREGGVLRLSERLVIVEVSVVRHGFATVEIEVDASADESDETGGRNTPA